MSSAEYGCLGGLLKWVGAQGAGCATILSLAAILAMTVAPVSGNEPGNEPTPAEARLQDLNVVVVDKQGAAITDLTKDDFEITDAGKKQAISFFRHTGNVQWPAQTLGPNQFSNRGGPQIPYATVILFDLMNEGFGSRGYAQNELVRCLENLESADYLYMYALTLDGRLFAVHGLPVGGAVPAPVEGPWTRQIKTTLDQVMRTVTQQRPVDVDVAYRVYLTFQALDNLGAQLSRVPGRKNLVWVTDGVPIELGPNRSDTGDFVDYTPQLRKLSESLDRSKIAIYPVRQVMLGAGDSIGNVSGEGQTGGMGTGIDSEATLDEFAGMTGGRPEVGKNIAAALKQALNDVHTSYQIGYYPPQENWNNKFHKLRVTCKRKGARVQAKTGYYAWAEAPNTRAQEAFDSAQATTFDAAEIGLTAKVSYNPSDGQVSTVDLRIDAHDVAWVHQGDFYDGQLRLTFFHYLSGGRTQRSGIIPLDLHYSAQQRDAALKDGIDFARDVPNWQTGSQFRIVVYDRGSNAVGSLTIPDRDAAHSTAAADPGDR